MIESIKKEHALRYALRLVLASEQPLCVAVLSPNEILCSIAEERGDVLIWSGLEDLAPDELMTFIRSAQEDFLRFSSEVA